MNSVERLVASISKTCLSVRVFGDDLDPDEISRILGAAPTRSYRRGEVTKLPKGGEIVAKRGSWSLMAEERSPGDLSLQIVEVLSRLNPDLSTWKALGKRYECDLFAGLFMEGGNEGEELTVEALVMMAERGLRLGLDVYERAHEAQDRQ